MTPSPGPVTRLQYRTFGPPSVGRTIVVLREGSAATSDPDSEITAAHDVRIIAVRLTPHEVSDPGTYGGETPAATTVSALREMLDEQLRASGPRLGLVGVGEVGALAIVLAGQQTGVFDRLALVAVPRPEGPLERDIAARALAEVTATTLILNGIADPSVRMGDAQWHADRLADAVIERVPPAPGRADLRLSLTDVWDRVLTHVAPG